MKQFPTVFSLVCNRKWRTWWTLQSQNSSAHAAMLPDKSCHMQGVLQSCILMLDDSVLWWGSWSTHLLLMKSFCQMDFCGGHSKVYIKYGVTKRQKNPFCCSEVTKKIKYSTGPEAPKSCDALVCHFGASCVEVNGQAHCECPSPDCDEKKKTKVSWHRSQFFRSLLLH